jgi:HEPN domain-containing protein
MKPLTMAWAMKAEADLSTAGRELQVRDDPNFDAVCYHAKECALNYLRARLQEAEIEFPSTAHLVVLLELCLDLEPSWDVLRDNLRILTYASNQILDPENRANRKNASEAYDMAKGFRDEVRSRLMVV